MIITEKLVQPGNYTPGREGHRIQHIVLHTEVGNDGSSWNVFNNPSMDRSAHYLVGENGEILHAVSEGDTAWHAANWPVNQSSIGIEHEDLGNYNDAVRTDAEYQSSAELVADICRRYGVPCVKVSATNHVPNGPGILLHSEVSQQGTACPDGLDWGRIISQAQAILGGTAATPPAQPAAAVPHPDYIPLNQSVTVGWGNLQVRNAPSTSAAGNQANTPDGMLHAGNVITITGYTHAERVQQNGVDSDIWIRSIWGHWSFGPGTDFPWQQYATPVAPPSAPAPDPAPAIPAPVPDSAPTAAAIPAQITAWMEDHKVVYTTSGGTTVDTVGTGQKQVTFGAGQRVDQSGVFTTSDGHVYRRTENGFKLSTWNGVPDEAFVEITPEPVAPVVAPVLVPNTVSAVKVETTGPTMGMDGIVRTTTSVSTVPAVPKIPRLSARAQMVATIAALVGAGTELAAAIIKAFPRRKK